LPSGPPTTQIGVASWYGPGFHGKPTSTGEIYNQYDLTAAHPSWPLGTRALVTNLDNGRAVEVRINDRGPFVRGRSIDLSYAAADALGLIGPGTGNVRIVPLPPQGEPFGALGTVRFAVQIAAFSDEAKAIDLRGRVAALPALRVQRAQRPSADVYVAPAERGQQRYYRVRVGPYVQRSEAESQASLLARLGLTPIVVEEVVPAVEHVGLWPRQGG
jgi:rare lipoprotein A